MTAISIHFGLWFLSFGLASLVLIRLGQYSLGLAAALTLVLGALASWLYSRTPDKPGFSFSGRTAWAGGAICLFAAFLYLAYPTYYLQGGRDHGVYALFSIHASDTGGLDFDQPLFREIHHELGDMAALSYPGLYSAFRRQLSDDPAKLIPQFQHLFPAFGAGFHSLFGIEGLHRANGVIAAIAVLFFFLVASRLLTPGPALLATAAVAINPAVIWNARAPFTEMLSLWLSLMGTLLVLHSSRRSPAIAAMAGAVLGAGVLARLDAGLNGLLILGGAIHLMHGPKAPAARHIVAMSTAYILVSGLGFLDGYVHSRPYFDDLWRDGSVKGLVAVCFGSSAIALALGLSAKIRGFFNEGRTRHLIRSAVILLAAWYFFHYFILAPIDHSFQGRSIQELGWYITPLVFVLTPIAMFAALKREDWHVWTPFILLLGFTSFVYLLKPSITPDHFWASRRWVPHVIPLFILFSAFGLQYLHGRFAHLYTKKQLAGAFLVLPTVTYLLVTVATTRPFLFKSLLEEQHQQYESFVRDLKASGPMPKYYLTRNIQVASILTYVYGVPTALLAKDGVTRSDFKKLIGKHFVAIPPGVGEYDRIVPGRIAGDYTERLQGRRPRRLILDVSDLTAGRLIRVGKNRD